MTKSDNNHIKSLTFLRFLAALLVIVFHFGQDVFPYNSNGLSEIIKEGSLAVSFFFFLSGVVLTLNYLKHSRINVFEFYLKRFARIYPNYLVAFIGTLLLGMIFNNSFPNGLSILLQVLSLQAWHPIVSLEINFPAWSISVEAFFYLLFPFILILLKPWTARKSTIVISTIWLVSLFQMILFNDYLSHHNLDFFGKLKLYFPMWHLNTFLAGILCAKYILKVQNSKKALLGRVLYCIGIALFIMIITTDNILKPYIHNGLLSPVFFLVISGLAMDDSIFTRFLGNKLFVLLGSSSYGMYIFQFPVFIVFASFYPSINIDSFSFNMYLISLIIFSIGMYLYFEIKLRDIILKRWLKK